MDRQYPIYTVETECQDCYKCVRHCPVKAIRIVNGRANAVPELCIACGRCVKVCPAKAKRVRDDLGRTLFAAEVPIGIVTSGLGAVVFLIIMTGKERTRSV